jgi:WD40 repeat protein
MDISLDSELIVTCSADKNVNIWGLDFGDCHKSIFAHEESIMQVAFERERGVTISALLARADWSSTWTEARCVPVSLSVYILRVCLSVR